MRLGIWPFGLLPIVTQPQQHQRQQQHRWSLPSFGIADIPRMFTVETRLAVQISRRRSTRPLLAGFTLPMRSTRAPTNTKPNRTPPRLRWSHDPGQSRNVAHRPRTRPVLVGPRRMAVVVPSDDDFNPNGELGGDDISLWLDMRTAILPAQQTLKGLYDELRDREEAKGRTPDDSDWVFGRVPDPVGAVLFADEPEERATEESEVRRCYVLGEGRGKCDVKTYTHRCLLRCQGVSRNQISTWPCMYLMEHLQAHYCRRWCAPCSFTVPTPCLHDDLRLR